MVTPIHRGARLMVIPGLHGSGPTHWQSWLQAQHRGAVRVEQDDWHGADLEAWATRIDHTLAQAGPGPWIAVAHSFGCLALARQLALRPASGIAAALFVAPAEPETFGASAHLPQGELPMPSTVVASDTDPWMTAASTRLWARRWGSHWLSLGDAGHINTESGFGPLPFARRWVSAMAQRLAREQRPLHTSIREWTFAV